MSQYLVIISIGPVQGFIAAARRSRDLWSGSFLLSEIAKTCARSLCDAGAVLIFPAVDGDEKEKLKKSSDFSVGNKIQVLIEAPDVEALSSIINKVKQAAQARFIEEIDTVKKAAGDIIRDAIWNGQKQDYIEIQSAWAKITDQKDAYRQAVSLAAEALVSRKATRDFSAVCCDPYTADLMLPKSSLDGVYETVLYKGKIKVGMRARLGLSDSEQLDCMGVIKRLGFQNEAEQFTPISRISAHAWIEKLIENKEELTQIRISYECLVGMGIATRVKGNTGAYQAFPYDAQFLYENRIQATMREYKHLNEAIYKGLDGLRQQLKPLWKKYGQPQSYGVLLLADGDKMGELLDKANNVDDHQAITTALSRFAESVSHTMRTFAGHCIYAGGDDVLGLVPLDTAYACAKALSESFTQVLENVAKGMVADTPTLSVGLAICHQMTPFAAIRDLAKQAENHAKGDYLDNPKERRNALGMVLSIRSGSDIRLRLRWDDDNGQKCFKYWQERYANKAIPSRIAYDIRQIALRTQAIALDNQVLQNSIRLTELMRLLKQARTNQGNKLEKCDIERIKERAEVMGLERLADELLVARWLAARTQKDLGRV